MAEATFQPAEAPGADIADYNQGFNQASSMMQRKQAFDQQTQLSQQQIQANAVLAPLQEATARAHIVGAGASIQNNVILQQLRTQAAAVSPQANQEFLQANQIADWDQKEQALGDLQAKYSWMENVPEYKPFLESIDNSRSNALKRSLMDQQIQEAQFRAQTAADARVTASEIGSAGRSDAANINASARTDAATTIAGGRTDVANINAASRQDVATTTAQGRYNAAKLKADRQFEIDSTIEKRDDYVRSGDTEHAQIMQDHLNKINAIGGGSPGRALPTSVPAAQPAPNPGDSSTPQFNVPNVTPAAKVTAPAKAPVVTVEGRNYPIFKDKSGNRAYLKDGKYIEIAPEDTPAQ